jgi:uncharacterized protein (DUF4415 family)
MAKRRSASSARAARTAKSGKRTPRIDYSDIPASSDEQLASMRRVGRPRLSPAGIREMIAIRLDPNVLLSFKEEAKRLNVGYQTLINDVLAEHARGPKARVRVTADREPRRRHPHRTARE